MKKFIVLNKNENFAFTLAEVLITLAIIGVVAALTIGTVTRNYQWQSYKSGLLKALSTLYQAAEKFKVTEGYSPRCGYWAKSPYPHKCVERDSAGYCSRYTLMDGSPLPPDVNGHFEDCTLLWRSFNKNLKAARYCKNDAYKRKCIPGYKGLNTVWKENKQAEYDKKGEGQVVSDYDVNSATGSSGFSEASIMGSSCSAVVLADGQIFFSYGGETARYFAVDVNGFKGPNKWGYDVYVIQPTMVNESGVPKFTPTSAIKEAGGKTPNQLLYDK